ncbi:MAG: DNA polymerase III subunit delta [Candidatus Magasanikbacteria bacterium]|nr:DNA polymerase III subunit delta [Candidatus Magasanikbacteria bacterium]
MIIFIYGKDTFRSRKYLNQMIKGFKEKRDLEGFNTVKIDCEKTKEIGFIWNEVLTVPFLAEKKMIVLENFFAANQDKLFELFAEHLKKGFFDKESKNVVVIWDGLDTVKKKVAKNLMSLLVKQPYTRKFDVLKSNELGGWIAKEAQSRGGAINWSASNKLAKNSIDMWQASSLLDQLLDYKDGEEITDKDVDLFVAEKADDNIFNLIDSILNKNSKNAYAMIRQQYKKGENTLYIFAMLLRQCRILLEIKDFVERNGQVNSKSLAVTLKMHPYVAQKSLSTANNYSLDTLKNFYSELLDFDIKIKTGQVDQSLLLDVLVGKFAEG